MKIKMNLGGNRECDTVVCEDCNKVLYDNIWRGEEHICKECEKGEMDLYKPFGK